MGKHDSHLPRKDHNKQVGSETVKATPKQLANVAAIQGSETKKDAKKARQKG